MTDASAGSGLWRLDGGPLGGMTGNDADMAVRLEIGSLDIREIFDAVLADQLHQFLACDQLRAEVAPLDVAVLDQQQRLRAEHARKEREAEGQIVDREVPSEDRRYQHDTFGDRVVIAR